MKVLIMGAALTVLAAGASAQPAAPAATTATGATVTGDWQGQVTAGKEQLPIILHLGAQVTSDSPSERVFGDPGKLEQAGDKLKLTFQSGGAFEGALGKDGKLEGTFSKGSFSAPIVLVRQAEAPKP
jgi:hypothetical protein